MAIKEIICGVLELGATCQSMPVDKLLIEYLLVPSVILIIFLYFAVDFVLRGSGLTTKGLLAIVMYIVVVYSGLYGIFAPFAYSYLYLMIILLMAGFFISRLISRESASTGSKKAGELYKKFKKKIPSEKDLRKLISHYTTIENEIERLKKLESLATDDEKKNYGRSVTEAEGKKEEIRWEIINVASDLKEKRGLSDKLEKDLEDIGIRV